MKTKALLVIVAALATSNLEAQDLKTKFVPAVVQTALSKKYPEATKVSWEKEKGNYEANWGGKTGEDNSVQFTPAGNFVEIVKAIKITDLPAQIAPYINAHYKGAKIKEAGKVTDAKGATMFEAEIKGSDLIFDEKGNFLKKD